MKRHLFLLIVLVAVTVLAWHKILFQVFQGEGYYYFGKSFSDFAIIDKLVNHDAGARIAFDLLEHFFRDNLFLYQLFDLVTLVTLGVLFYFLVWEISRKKLTAFVAAILFTVSFNGIFNMFGHGDYNFFIERAVWFVFLFPSGLYLVRFLKTGKERHFFISVVIYMVSLYLSRYSIFFLPFLLCYLLASVLFVPARVKNKLLLGLRLLFYLIPTFVLLHFESKLSSAFLLGKKDFFSFLIGERAAIVEATARQLAVLLFPPQIIDMIIAFQMQTFEHTIRTLYVPGLIFFVFLVAFSVLRNKVARVPVLAASLFIFAVFVLDSFARGTTYQVNLRPGDRYLFVPVMGYSIILSFFLVSLASQRNILLRSFVALIIIFLVYTNIRSIWRQMDSDFYKHIAVKKSLQYIKNLSPTLSVDSFVVIPSALGYYGAIYAEWYHGREETIFYPFFADWPAKFKRPFDPQKDSILEYDRKEERVIDMTSQYEKLLYERQKK